MLIAIAFMHPTAMRADAVRRRSVMPVRDIITRMRPDGCAGLHGHRRRVVTPGAADCAAARIVCAKHDPRQAFARPEKPSLPSGPDDLDLLIDPTDLCNVASPPDWRSSAAACSVAAQLFNFSGSLSAGKHVSVASALGSLQVAT